MCLSFLRVFLESPKKKKNLENTFVHSVAFSLKNLPSESSLNS